jgi:hypothetical protein
MPYCIASWADAGMKKATVKTVRVSIFMGGSEEGFHTSFISGCRKNEPLTETSG